MTGPDFEWIGPAYGDAEGYRLYRDPDCTLDAPEGDPGPEAHTFNMIKRASVIQDTNIMFDLVCGCSVGIPDPFNARVITLEEPIGGA